ncbi:MAG: hypothetical protein A2Z11_03640 [Candidatus Woykebacteria bacterium RBG_16_43_9]|uniref:Ribbon-helix-helix protein CopG domain-containing protein n=1 Tax=Candidatus Woykebacteria bacterium RBG_16_43_9 TaxID=1802596 RepID=A0A1G1WCS6_9BACT|nr:MAG: hypothetical protein A2Z11_03640 [Candidatus Woykebacteria bacterium RBG_16_43_9]
MLEQIMKRKQIYLTETLDREIKYISLKQNKPQSEVIRDILEKNITKKKKKMSGGDFLLWMAKHAGKGPKDLSKNLDRYLYGDKSIKYGHLYRKKKSTR